MTGKEFAEKYAGQRWIMKSVRTAHQNDHYIAIIRGYFTDQTQAKGYIVIEPLPEYIDYTSGRIVGHWYLHLLPEDIAVDCSSTKLHYSSLDLCIKPDRKPVNVKPYPHTCKNCQAPSRSGFCSNTRCKSRRKMKMNYKVKAQAHG